MRSTAIVVGIDGTASSTAAVRWAAREAVRRGVVLRVVHAFAWHWEGGRFDGGTEYLAAAQDFAGEVTAAAVAEATAAAPGVLTETAPLVGNPIPQLLEAARDAALVVLGSRGRGGFASLLLGSVSQQVATRAACPVVVVRGRADPAEGPVVVGLDDSPTADDVLGAAFEAAAARGCALVAVRSYLPPMPLWIGDAPLGGYPMPADSDADEHSRLDEMVAAWRQKYPAVTAETVLTHDGAAAVLVGVSHTAQLVVVGSHGHGALARTLLGSTALQLLHHADCPVLVYRHRTEA
jgi:nucleotide-binding universal stress UspA family protein